MDILICDDEPLAVERLSRLVSQLGHQVIATAQHGQQALEMVQQFEPDVVLLDIQMPEMDGLSCAQHLAHFNPTPAIVFCTAFDEHALQAIQSQAKGYLLKPIAKDDLETVLESVTKLTQAQLTHLEKKELMEEKVQRQQIAAKTYRDQKYVTVRHKNGSVLIDETLKDLETEFADRFIRIHRNALISLDYLDGLEMVSSGQYQVRCRELDERLAVSRRHLPLLRERMQNL
ncbi:unnamed protein product [Oppiella nova]|uniref:DNA-binding response regulator n=1 Tax=Oppiella nova TaxID=334625 RepID=A0A7R9QCT2_9ACAR|nr:unnamed protein product [Oppiella nova]CAG2163221.1 unnamed protein product [Oppiella nova]